MGRAYAERASGLHFWGFADLTDVKKTRVGGVLPFHPWGLLDQAVRALRRRARSAITPVAHAGQDTGGFDLFGRHHLTIL